MYVSPDESVQIVNESFQFRDHPFIHSCQALTIFQKVENGQGALERFDASGFFGPGDLQQRYYQVPLVVRSLRLRLRQALIALEKIFIAPESAFGGPKGPVGRGLLVCHEEKVRMRFRQGFQHFRGEGRNPDRLLPAAVGIKADFGGINRRIEVLAGQKVPDRLDPVLYAVAFI